MSSSSRPAARLAGPLTRVALRVLAVVSLGMAVLGALLPGLPCTEFVLLAAWAAARSSPRLHAWLLTHRWFGPSLTHWRNGRRITRRAKLLASVSMSVCAVGMVRSIPHPLPVTCAILCMVVVVLWLWSRPEPT